MAKECKLCKLGDGICTTGFRKQHERAHPNCRLHGVTDRGNSRPRQSSEAASSTQPPRSEGGTATSSLRPLSEMTHFRTRQGNLILFTPQPMDSWIGKEVLEDQSAGGYKDAATGKLLNQKQAKSYAAFCKRRTRRCHTGDKVDKYLRLVDKYQPRVFAEARIYVARFPEQVGDLLKQIKKVRKRIRKKRGRARQPKLKTPSSSGEAAPSEVAPCASPDGGASRDHAQREGPTPAPSPEHATKGGDADAASERRETVDADMPPDWGDSSGDDAAPSYDWVWGEAGRPSDRGDSPSHLALRPSEPGGSPPPQAHPLDSHTTERGDVRLVPNVQWRGVQLIQEHMAKARAERDAL